MAQHLRAEQAAGRRVVIAGASEGSLERLRMVLADHGVEGLHRIERWDERTAAPGRRSPCCRSSTASSPPRTACWPRPTSSATGSRRPARRARRSDKFIAEVAALGEGDLVVHNDHGIGRYDGLVTLELGGAPHDCLRLIYQGGDKLFVPVENLDVLSRYGAAEGEVALDKLGGLGWQTRKARVKKRIREIAGELIEIAARRAPAQGRPARPRRPASTRSSPRASPMTRPRIRRARSRRCSTIWPRASRWTG